MFIKIFIIIIIAGRRKGNGDGKEWVLTLGAILKFFTGEHEEPLLGYHVAPKTEFVPVADDVTMMPTASTCMNTLYLPRPSSAERERQLKTKDYYDQLDVAFITEFFGKA